MKTKLFERPDENDVIREAILSLSHDRNIQNVIQVLMKVYGMGYREGCLDMAID